MPFHEFTLTYNKQSKVMCIWRAIRGEGSELGILARTQITPQQVRIGIVLSAEKGWRRDAGKLSRNRGKSPVYIYTLSC